MRTPAATQGDHAAPRSGSLGSRSRRLRSSLPRRGTRVSPGESDHAPFIAHPIVVGRLLHCDGQPDEVIAAGLLHDLLEKTRTTSPELQRRFGARVARLVESVSDDPSIVDYEQRKSQLRDRVAHAESDTLAIFAADKIAKVRELARLPPERLRDPQTRAKLAHYRASLEMLRQTDAAGTLVDLLDAELNRFVAPEGSGTHNDDQSTTVSSAKLSKRRARRI
jgi:hypothetical protein